jgi:hypothetical protein
MVSYRTQTLALSDHSDGFPLLMRGQLWLGPELYAALLGGSSPPPLARAMRGGNTRVADQHGKGSPSFGMQTRYKKTVHSNAWFQKHLPRVPVRLRVCTTKSVIGGALLIRLR